MEHFTVDAEVVNVSKGGMSVECDRKLERGKLYSVRLFWCGSIYNAKCEAVWTLDRGCGQRYRSGIKFVQVDDDTIIDFVTCLEEHMADARRLHPRMKLASTRALLSYP